MLTDLKTQLHEVWKHCEIENNSGHSVMVNKEIKLLSDNNPEQKATENQIHMKSHIDVLRIDDSLTIKQVVKLLNVELHIYFNLY